MTIPDPLKNMDQATENVVLLNEFMEMPISFICGFMKCTMSFNLLLILSGMDNSKTPCTAFAKTKYVI